MVQLTPAQAATFAADVAVDPTLSALPPNSDSATTIAKAYAQPAAGEWIVWRTDVTAEETGNAWLGTDIDGMSSLNMQRLQLLLASAPSGIYDMSRVDRRDGFELPFGTNPNNGSRVAMRAVWKRQANRLEKLFASGTGTTGSPATMTVVGIMSYIEVMAALGW